MPATLYGVLVFACLGIAWLSHDVTLQKMGLMLVAAWAFTNFAVVFFGYEKAPIVIPSFDALLALFVAGIYNLSKSAPALVVLLLFLVEMGFAVGGFIGGIQGGHDWYLCMNLIFLAQALVIGGASVQRCWASWRVERLHHRRFSGMAGP